MAEGFRAAEAYVEVTADLDDRPVLSAARRAAEGLEDALQQAGRRAGSALTETLGRAGGDAGTALVSSTEGRLRDARGRFIGAGTKISGDVRKGTADDFDRNGFSSFMGLLKAVPRVGKEAATGITEGLSGGLKGAAGPAMMGVLVAGATTAGPFVGAVLAGGIIAGVASAGIAGGIAAQARDPEVKHAFGELGGDIGDILKGASSPFKAELLETAAQGRSAFQRWEPMFRQIFGVSSTMMDPFTNALERAGDRLLPSIMTTINNARGPVNALADGLEGTVDAVADVLDMLDDNGPEAAVALRVAFILLQGNIRNVGRVVNGLTEGFGHLIEFGLDFAELLGTIGQAMTGIPGPLGDVGAKLAGLVPLTNDWRGSWEGLKNDIQGATDTGSAGTTALAERTQFLALSMGAAIREAGSLSEAFNRLNGGALSAREAESDFQAAIDGATAALQANGKGLDLRTEKGRANDAALRTLIGSTDALAQATYDETLATQGSAAAEAAAITVYERGRAQLIKSAQAMGMSKAEAIAYADKIMKIPKNWTTTAKAETAAAAGQITSFHKSVMQKDGTVINYVVKVTRTGDHYIPGQGTQLKAAGGPIMGGSGWKDDVPVLAMGGEWVIQKAAVRALERQFGSGFMAQLNTWHQGGQGGGTRPIRPALMQEPQRRSPVHQSTAGGGTRPAIHIGSIVVDVSRLQSVQDLIHLVSNLQTGARSLRARTVSGAGR